MTANRLRGKVAMVAAYATQQGEHPDKTAWDLGLEAFRGALQQSGIKRDRIDGLLTETTQDGSGQMEPTRFGQMVGLNPRASGSLHYATAGFTTAYAAGLIASGQCQVVACVYGTNQRTSKFRFHRASDPFGAPYGFLNPAGFAGLGYQRYLHKYDRLADRDKIGAVAIAQRKHAMLNPIALRREPMTWEDYRADRFVVWPLRRSDICLITDGGVCFILADAEIAADLTDHPIYLQGIGRQDALRMLENEDHLLIPHMKSTATQIYERTGVGPRDLDALYVQDAHAPAVILTLENYGFCGEGEALDWIQDGRIELGGELPVNTHGGQLSEGYMVGWLHQVEMFRQLRGEAGARQVPDCELVQFCATGGFREFTLSLVYANQP
ncbi:MAG: thiolase family protein [Rhodospirillales bacterium]|nr:thiolase family protein [Rhodospirillales bacterium]